MPRQTKYAVCCVCGLVVCRAAMVEVVVAASRAHYEGLVVVVGSAANSSRAAERLRFHVLVPPTESTQEVEALLQCTCPRSSLVVRSFELGTWASGARLTDKSRLAEPLNFARFFVAELLPAASTAVYLDSDVLVRGDLLDLHAEAQAKLDGQPDALVAVVPRDYKRVCGHVVVDCDKVPNPDELHAFNAGVLVVDLERWREARMLQVVEAWVLANHKDRLYALGSNPPLVLAVRDRFVRLHPTWNCMRGLRKQHAHNANCWLEARIRHYPGDHKPWAELPPRSAWGKCAAQ